jgi:DNA-binding NtrC family response regulator
LGLFAARYKREKKTLTRGALRRLQNYDWPGNVRQLEHVLLNAWVLSDQAEIDVEDLDLPAAPGQPNAQAAARTRPDSIGPTELEDGDGDDDGETMKEEKTPRQTLSSHLNDERTRIAEALAACNWNRVRAAEMLGMPRRTFYRRLKQYQLQ